MIKFIVIMTDGLNPCCSGQWSRTSHNYAVQLLVKVLILVVVDNGLVPTNDKSINLNRRSLNPCCSGQWSRTN